MNLARGTAFKQVLRAAEAYAAAKKILADAVSRCESVHVLLEQANDLRQAEEWLMKSALQFAADKRDAEDEANEQ